MKTARKATNVSLDTELLAQAREFNVNLSRAAETGISDAVRKAQAERWLKENRAALESYNDWIDENGLPLDEYRQF